MCSLVLVQVSEVILILFFLIHNIFLLKSVHLLVKKHRIPVPNPGLVNVSKQDVYTVISIC